MSDDSGRDDVLESRSMGAEIDTVADRFEAAWLAGGEPRIEEYLGQTPAADDPEASHQLLPELVMIDLEHRWRRATERAEEATPIPTEKTPGTNARPSLVAGPRLEDYVRRFPVLGSVEELPTDVIAFEYRVRHLWGDRPRHEHYLKRLPAQADQLASVLAGTDKDLSSGTADAPSAQCLANIQRQLGRYKLLEPLGRGGMGTVYKAKHTKLDCHVAVKVMRPDLNDEPEAVARFQREMKAVGGLSHPNLVRALDADQISGTHVLVMEYVDGIDIATLLKRTGPLPIADACELVRQAALGLHHAHEHGLVHRDIKPSNLMLAVSDQPSAVRSGDRAPQSEIANRQSAIVRVVDKSAATDEVGDKTDHFLPAAYSDPRTADQPLMAALMGNRIAWVIAAVSLLLLVGLGVAAWQIIIQITDRNTEVVVTTSDGGTVRVGPGGKVEVKIPQRPPISQMALVTNPAAIEGVRSWTIETRGHRGEVHTVRYSPDGKLMATGCEDGTIRVWDPETGELDKALIGHDGAVRDLSWAPDSRQLASGSVDDTVRVWDVPSGRETQETEVDNPSGLPLFVSFSPDGKTLAYGGADEEIHLWDIEADDTRTLEGPAEGVQSVTWAGDGKTLVAANANKTLTVWDVPSGKAKATLKGHTGEVTDVAVSPDGKTLASTAASPDAQESVRIWDMATGKPRNALPAFQHGAQCIVFSPDGKLLITGGAEGDGRLRVWNIDTGQLVYEQEPHDGTRSIASVAVSPSGTLLAIAHHDGTVALCNLQTGESVRALPKAKRPAAVSPEGHLDESPEADGDFVYVVHDDSGQSTLPPDQFSERYAWKNDPQRAVVAAKSVGEAVPDEEGVAGERQAQPDLQEPEGPITETMPTKVEGDLDRQIAEWVLSVGGSVKTYDQNHATIEHRADLPSGAFQLSSVILDGYTELDEAGLRRLAQLANTEICNLYLNETNVTDSDLEYLTGITPLAGIHLRNTKITDAGLVHLTKLPNLNDLGVDSCAIIRRLFRWSGPSKSRQR